VSAIYGIVRHDNVPVIREMLAPVAAAIPLGIGCHGSGAESRQLGHLMCMSRRNRFTNGSRQVSSAHLILYHRRRPDR